MKKDLKVNGLTLLEYIQKETEEVTIFHWGEPTTFKPVICSEKIGDGQQLIYVGTIGQRPYYWLVLIDSSSDINDSDFDIDEILELIEDEFGKQDEFLTEDEFYQLLDEPCNDFDTYEDWYKHCYEYPAFGWDGGHYGVIVNMVTGFCK